jgi:hypothetical protein
MPTIDLTDDELAAVAAATRRAIEEDKLPAPRPLRSALAFGIVESPVRSG